MEKYTRSSGNILLEAVANAALILVGKSIVEFTVKLAIEYVKFVTFNSEAYQEMEEEKKKMIDTILKKDSGKEVVEE